VTLSFAFKASSLDTGVGILVLDRRPELELLGQQPLPCPLRLASGKQL
jgi:hypothetical protein